MFGPGFEDCWSAIPGAPGLELSGDVRFRGPRGVHRTRHDPRGRPYVMARKTTGQPGEEGRPGRVLLHRAVMGVLPGREPAPGELVCRDNDPRHNRLANLYLGDHRSKAAGVVRSGLRPRVDRHSQAKLSDEQVYQVRLALTQGERRQDLARAYGVHKSTISRIKTGSRRPN